MGLETGQWGGVVVGVQWPGLGRALNTAGVCLGPTLMTKAVCVRSQLTSERVCW